jgi:hypothetical protein
MPPGRHVRIDGRRASGDGLARRRRRRPARAGEVCGSDCRATEGVDPVPAAAGLAELLVVGPAADADDSVELAAAAANARLVLGRRPSEVVEALNKQLRTA